MSKTSLIKTLVLTGMGLVFAIFIGNIIFDKPDTSPKVIQKIINIGYCEEQKNQTIDLYLPIKNNDQHSPIFIFIHGGGWHSGDKNNPTLNKYINPLLGSGFAVASINYRLAPLYKYPTQNSDVSCAIQKIASISEEYELNIDKTILAGESAGGLLALMYTLTDPYIPVNIRGVLSLYGTTDLAYQLSRKSHKNTNALNYLGSTDIDIAKEASPLYQNIPSNTPPILFIHGEKDTMVDISQAEKMYQKIKQVNPRSKFIKVKNAGHNFSGNPKPNQKQIQKSVLDFAKNSVKE